MIGAPIDSCGPTYGGGTIVTPGAVSGEEAPPLDLRPVNPTNGTSSSSGLPPEAPQSARPTNGTDKALYQSYKPPGGSPSARREAPSVGLTIEPDKKTATRAADPLANLPQLDPPAELAEVPQTAAGAAARPRSDPRSPAPDNPPRGTGLAAPPEAQATPGAEALSLAPGIRAFKVVEPRLAGGSLPSDAGWAWLADQGGYKTVIDLRPSDDVRSSDVASINAVGLRYLALPASDDQIDRPALLARFASEIGQESARPIYFFDSDGSRAAVLWYLHQVATLKAAPDEAQRAASEIGPRNAKLWAKAAAVVESLRPAPTADTFFPAPEPPVSAVPDREASIGAATERPSTARKTATNVAGQPFTAGSDRPPAQDPTAWKPYAALAAAGLGVPLAFLGRSAISRVVSGRASQPEAERTPRAIAFASDE
jgi:protein tyrosine phosphatase (PTP) superfamily phosphohydrolase (DUF442 family)